MVKKTKEIVKKVKVTVDYFDMESGEDKTFSEQNDAVSVIGISRTEKGTETSVATIGSGSLVDVAIGAARMVAPLILEVDNPKIKMLATSAYIKTFYNLIKKDDPVLGMMIPIALELVDVEADEEDDAEESDGEE